MAEHTFLHRRGILRILRLCSMIVPAMLTGTAHGQNARDTARQRIWLRAYGTFSRVGPNFAGDTNKNGATLGGDIDGFRLLPHTQLGLDARYTISTGSQSKQYYFGGGPRFTVLAGRFRPYGDLLFGHGKSVFTHPNDPGYTHDEAGALTYGGGLDYQLTRTWALRADVQRERWRFSQNSPYLYPVAVSIGASYQFHFRGRTGPGL